MFKKFKRLAKSALFQLFFTVALGLLFGKFLSPPVQSFFYALSLTLKEALLFVLPFVIASCLFSCLLSFQNSALKIILTLFAGICVSNLACTLIGYTVSKYVLHSFSLFSSPTPQSPAHTLLTPLWDFHIPSILSNHMALLCGLVASLVFSFYQKHTGIHLANLLRRSVTIFLNKIFVPVLPLFALGFLLKLQSDGLLFGIIKLYLPLVFAIVITQATYTFFLYFAGAHFKTKPLRLFLKNVAPAGIVGFGTMSSMAALPLSIRAAEQNTKHTDFPRTIVPASVNIHLMGDSIAIPMMALALLSSFAKGFPSFETFFIFACFFVLAKFAVAAIPGGGIVVMIPILEKYLGFTPEMAGLITTLYILLDPVITTANVLGNGAFAILMTKLLKKLSPPPTKSTAL